MTTMMTQLKIWAAAGLAFGLAACGHEPEPGEDAAEARPDKAALIEDFEAALAKAATTQGPGEPAIWTLSDDDTDLYLLGTVHLLRPEVEWRSDRFETILDAADTIVFEVDTKSPEAVKAITTDFNQRGMFEDGQTLRSVLNDADEALIEEALSSLNVPLDAFNTFEPWMVAISLSSMKLLAEGYDLNSGVENVIEGEARAAGKQFAFLEDISNQADAFDLLPMEDQIDYLYETAVLLDESTQMLDQLVEEWADGDVAGLTTLVADPEALGSGEALYQAVLVDRNANWIPKIEAMLDTPGTVLIAVGSAHLVGPDSVVQMLRDKGYEVEGP